MIQNLEKYREKIDFINHYRKTSNAATGSVFDPNANVETKNIATMTVEIPKGDMIGINRLMMHDKITELFGSEMADEYIRQLTSHEIYRNDETTIMPYCVSITMYPFLFDGLRKLGGHSDAPTHLDSFCGSFINLVFAIAAQFAGAVSTPEWLTYMDYFIRKEYGDDYYIKADRYITDPCVLRKKTIGTEIESKFQQVVYSLNQPAAARGFQCVN